MSCNSMNNQAQDDQIENLEDIPSAILPTADSGSNMNSNCEVSEIQGGNEMNPSTSSMNGSQDSEVCFEGEFPELSSIATIKIEPISVPNSPEHVANVEEGGSEQLIEAIKIEPMSTQNSPEHVANDDGQGGSGQLIETIKTEPISVPNSPVHEPQDRSVVKVLYITRPIKLEMPSPVGSPEREPEYEEEEEENEEQEEEDNEYGFGFGFGYEEEDEDMEVLSSFMESPQSLFPYLDNQDDPPSTSDGIGTYVITPIVMDLDEKTDQEIVDLDHMDASLIDGNRQNSNNDSNNDDNSDLQHESAIDNNGPSSSDNLFGDRKDKS